jgi:hypothetical protein
LVVAAHQAAAAPVGVPYSVFGPTVKIIEQRTAPSSQTHATIQGAGNEFVSFQVAFPGNNLGVSLAAGQALTGPGGTISNGNMTIYREVSYSNGPGSTANREIGAWPDALIPTVDRLYGEARDAFPVDVPAGEWRTGLVDVHIPPGQAAGGYDGSVVATDDFGRRSTIPVHLDVFGFELPSTSSLRSMFQIGWRTPCDALYGSACDPFGSADGERRAWQADTDVARLGLDDRVTIGDPAMQPPIGANDPNFLHYTLPLIDGTANTQLAGAKLTAVTVGPTWHPMAQAHGFTDRAVLYESICDEKTMKDEWDACKTVIDKAREGWPDLPNLMTATIDTATKWDSNYGITDILTPVVDYMDSVSGAHAGDQHHNYDTFRALPGKQVWLYTSCDVSGCKYTGESDPYYEHPWADYTIDTAAGQNRAMGWLAYTYGATGELYYATDTKMATAWDDQVYAGGYGDGTLFYPGTTDRIGGQTPIPLDSLRLKLIRDGHQDYEYLRLAAERGHADEAYAIAKSLYPSTHDTDATDTTIDNTRRQLAALITG